MKKLVLRLSGCRKCYLLIFVFFFFPNFKWILSKKLWNYHPLLKWISRILMKFYCVTNIFDLHTFNNETTVLLNFFFKISTEMHFVSLFFLNKRNITTSHLMINFKMYCCALCCFIFRLHK